MVRKFILAIMVFVLMIAASSCKEEYTPSYPVQSESVRVEVYAEEKDKEYAQAIPDRVSRIHDTVYQNLGMEMDEKMKFVLYSDIAAFKEAVGDEYEENLIAHNEGNVAHILSLNYFKENNRNQTSALYAPMYEYVNIVLENANKKIPDYLSTGMSYYLVNYPMSGFLSEVQKAVEENALPTLKELEKLDDVEGKYVGYSYILVDYIVAEYGYDKLAEFVEKPEVKKIFGKSGDEFSAEWHTWSKKAYARDFDEIKETEHFTVEYMNSDSNIIQEFVQTLENSYDEITTALNVTIPEKVKTRLYPTFDEFNRALLTPNEGEGHLGQMVGGLIYVVSPNDVGVMATREAMLRTAVHEFVHAALNYVNKSLPSYLHEATAAYLAKQSMDFGMPEMYIPYMINNDVFISMEDLKNYNAYTNTSVYIIGYVLIEYIVDEYGNEKLVELLKAPEDYSAVFGKSDEDFYADWVMWLKDKYCN